MAYHGDRKLYRDTKEGIVAGVCAGLSEYFKIDVTLIRVVVGVLSIVYGSGILIYILLWFLLPSK
ncbi:MAG TPA: PspC domain-containing protein [Erysipelothrix sp.]|nr:PspC domain-containing protein [Erysipelothrix sp.]